MLLYLGGTMKFRKYIKEESTGLGADGLSKARLKTLLYKETKKCTYNKLYKDSGWNGPQCIWDTFNDLNLNWHITKSEYHTEKNPAKSMTFQMPVRKEWQFEIQWDSNKGRPMKLGGHVTAAGAGSVDDPLSKYDVNMVIW
jgi:hypothetical protein